MEGILSFISDEAYTAHLDYVNTSKLKYSILEKSYPIVKGRSLLEIGKQRLPKDVKCEMINLRCEILCHELYFSSFGRQYQNCNLVGKRFGSVASFLYNLSSIARSVKQGFLIIYERGEEFLIYCGDDYSEIFLRHKPLLCIDLYEHAYFKDYGFNKEKYVTEALSYLNLGLLDKK